VASKLWLQLVLSCPCLTFAPWCLYSISTLGFSLPPAQERLDEFSKQKNEKGEYLVNAYVEGQLECAVFILNPFPCMFSELRHIGTQISSDSHGSIDKSE
jgi:hypothetical protein